MNKLIAEIFAVGRWNGMEFTAEDLNLIADTFAKLKPVHKVPLKFGHNDDQPMTDGQPALGWVDRVWVDGKKLMAEFVDVPTVVMSAVGKKLYRKVSIELDFDVEHKGKQYAAVLSGVALLGADIPAVSTLQDLDHYIDRGARLSVGRRAVFSACAGNLNEGEQPMDIKELSEKVETLTAQFSKVADENKTLASENATLKEQVAKFAAEKKAAEEAALTERVKAKRESIKAKFDKAVKDENIVPAQRLAFERLLKLDDDASVDAIDLTEVDALCAVKGASFSTGDSAQAPKTDERPVGIIVDAAVREEMKQSGSKDYGAAMLAVFKRDPALAKRYQNLEG